jgi:hypothetical protein
MKSSRAKVGAHADFNRETFKSLHLNTSTSLLERILRKSRVGYSAYAGMQIELPSGENPQEGKSWRLCVRWIACDVVTVTLTELPRGTLAVTLILWFPGKAATE